MIATPATAKQYYFPCKTSLLFTVVLCRTCISKSVAAFTLKNCLKTMDNLSVLNAGKKSILRRLYIYAIINYDNKGKTFSRDYLMKTGLDFNMYNNYENSVIQ